MSRPSRRTTISVCLITTLAWAASPRSAAAQNWSFDARAIALGGAGSNGNLADTMIKKQRRYTAIPLPFGLFQVLGDLNIYDPGSPTFDPIRAVEYAASPIHYVVNRDGSNSGEALFVADLRNATLSRDLTRYRGFVPANDLLAEGLVSPNWGGTIKLRRDASGSYHGLYIGAGPYLSQQVAATFDPRLTVVFETGVNVRNAVMPIANTDTGQVAGAVTAGYRARVSNVYVAANFNYLRGFLYENDRLTVNLATDAAGLLTAGSSVFINHRHATSGTGYSVDLGVGAGVDRWTVGFGANGIANRIDWTGIRQSTLALASLDSGNGTFAESATSAAPDTRVELPIDYRGNVTYDAGQWSARAEAGHGFGDASFHGGVEKRFGRLEARGGARYTFSQWNPTGGIGVDLSRKVSFDVALFGTTTNIERKRQLAIAASVRINHD